MALKRHIPRDVSDGIPRRACLWLNTTVELAIRDAHQQVEKMPADTRLTKAVMLLDEARNLVADYIDEKQIASDKTLGKNR